MEKPSLERLLHFTKERRLRDWAGDIVLLGGAALLAKWVDDLLHERRSAWDELVRKQEDD